jgi:NADH dehydrogenase [ubiquinone] 1 alpha subcomplex assembly factor 5
LLITTHLNITLKKFKAFCEDIRAFLRPKSPFIGALLGGDTLFELRSSLLQAEYESMSGVSTRISPMMKMADVAALLSDSRFKDVTVFSEDIIMLYPTMKSLMKDLQLMGESAAFNDQNIPLKPKIQKLAESIYIRDHSASDQDMNLTSKPREFPNCLRATFQVLSFIAWT